MPLFHDAVLMEVFPAKLLFSPIGINLHVKGQPWHMNSYLPDFATLRPLLRWKRHSCGIQFPHVILRSKKSLFQDFQGFAEPSRLLPVTEAKFCSGLKLEEILAFSKFGMPSLYVVQLFTSIEFGSSLVDSDAAILLCLMDIDGNSVLQRISAALTEDLESGKETSDCQERRFQRGSVDTIIFQGPEMGKVNAAWIGLESGSWRLSNVRLIVITLNDSSDLAKDSKEVQYNGLRYDFEANNVVLLREGDGASMIELRPKSVTDFPMSSTLNLFGIGPTFLTSTSEKQILNEESMNEFTNLKLYLLIYDSILVSIGTGIFSVSTNEKAANTFLFGGIMGFLYLLLLQKSVDGLSASTLSPAEQGTKSIIASSWRI